MSLIKDYKNFKKIIKIQRKKKFNNLNIIQLNILSITMRTILESMIVV